MALILININRLIETMEMRLVKKITLIFCITLIGIGLADTTKADVTKGNWIVRSGYTFLVPQLSNESLIEIEKYSMPTLSFSYLVTDNLAIEFLVGIPTGIDVFFP